MKRLDLRGSHLRVVAWQKLTYLGAAMSLALLLWLTVLPNGQQALAATGDWPTYQLNNARTGYNSTETTINASTARNLKQHWVRTVPAAVFSQPVEANGTIYWGSWDGFEHATQLSGTDTWATNLGQTTDNNCNPRQVGVASTATVAGATVYVGGGDAQFYALNANNGTVIWHTALGSSPSHFIWSSPAVFNNSVYVGVSSFGDCPLVQGELVQMNASTGTVQHIFEVVPNGCTGGGVWGSPTVDEAAGTIYFATGNPGSCTKRTPYTEAVIEVHAADLSLVNRRSFWQVRGSDMADLDFGSTPTLFQATIGGVLTPLVGVVNKDGTFYAFDRTALGSGPKWRANVAQTGSCPQCGNGSIAPAAWDGTRLYVGGGATTVNGMSCAGSVSALDAATGASIWRGCMTSGTVLGAIAAVSGVILFGQGTYFMASDASTGNALFQYQDTNPGSQFWGAASVSSGVVYIGNQDGHLFAFGL
jgi:outer membrane protein assembly factor BamB